MAANDLEYYQTIKRIIIVMIKIFVDDVGDDDHDDLGEKWLGADALELPGFTVYDGWSTRHLYTQPAGSTLVMLSYACMLR